LEVLALEDIGTKPRVSSAVSHWLTEVERAGEEKPETEAKRVLIYQLVVAPDWNGIQRFRVLPIATHPLKNGSFSVARSRPVDPNGVIDGGVMSFVDSADTTILAMLARHGLRHGGSGRDGRGLDGQQGAEILEKLLSTGRCRWRALDGPVLTRGETRAADVTWLIDRHGRQRPNAVVEGGGEVGVLAPPWYLDPVAATCGPVEIGMTPKLAAAFLTAPPLTPAEAEVARARLAEQMIQHAPAKPAYAVPPQEQTSRQRIAVAPVPKLRLHSHRLLPAPYWPSSSRQPQVRAADIPLARLSFLYDGHEIALDDKNPKPVITDASGASVEIKRSRKAEAAAVKRLEQLGFTTMATQYRWAVPGNIKSQFALSPGDAEDHDYWLDFLLTHLPALTEKGWVSEIAESFPIRLAVADGDIDAALTPGAGIDWFELNLGIPIDGKRVDILPALLKILRTMPSEGLIEFLDDDENDNDLLRLHLDDGRVLPLRQGRIRPILSALASLFDSGRGGDDGKLILRRADAVDVAAMEQNTAIIWRGGEALRALGRRLRDGGGLPDVVVPESFTGTLRPYQQSGLAWLQLLRETGLGGLLADDMGLGKTVQVLAHIAIEKASGRMNRPCLVVAPTSLMPNWRQEAASFTPHLSVLVQHGTERKSAFESLSEHDLVLTTYALLARDVEILMTQEWHLVIIDEAQFVKNPATVAAKALRRLNARHRLALTGTPLENHLGELWALFDFVSPGFLGPQKDFAKNWRTPIEKKGDGERQKRLAGRVKPFLLRRTKAAVAADLPPKTEITESIELGAGQRAVYEGIRLAVHRKVQEAIAAKGLKRSRIEFLDALLKLRQVCCDPRLVNSSATKPGTKIGSAKLERLMEMVPELIDEGRRILIFSQFTSMLDLIQQELVTAKIPYLILTGQTRDRETPVTLFQQGKIPVFLISLKAGGTGLNLTAADTVIHYDPWWNPAVEAQATDRAHRIGQEKPVFVHKLVALDTIEVKMADLKARKQSLADGLFDPDQGGALDITEEDIAYLLGDPE